MSEHKYCLLVNPTAGKGRALKVLEKVRHLLSHTQLKIHTVITENVNHAKAVTTEAIARGETIAALGGDGTVRAVASVIHALGGTLALIPAGRGNDLARTLHIPEDPEAAFNILTRKKQTAIDIAKINNQFFLGICSLGIDSVANGFANQAKFIKGPSAYLYGGLRALLNWKHIKFKIDVDGQTLEHEGYTVAVANSQCYGGGMFLAPNASLQDGLLNIILVGKIPKYRLLTAIPRLFNKTFQQEKHVTTLSGRSVKIMADEKFMVFADGDPISTSPVEICVVPNALNVIIP
jgi:YegS/Rv2252/BmrU family lipid kinase